MNLEGLKVKSFVVNLESEKVTTVKGGLSAQTHPVYGCWNPSGFGNECGQATLSRYECDPHAA